MAKITALAIAIAIAIVAWMWGEGFGWRSMIVAGLGGYVLSKFAIALLLIGPREGLIIRTEQQRITDASLRDKPDRRS